MSINIKPWVYGIIAGLGIIGLFIAIISLFSDYGIAVHEFKKLWLWLIPLASGFGIQIGLYASIAHDAAINRGVATSGTISGGSMLACCSHYLLNIIPFIGLSGLATFLMDYQKWFFGIGIASSIVGIYLLLRHKNEMKKMKGGKADG